MTAATKRAPEVFRIRAAPARFPVVTVAVAAGSLALFLLPGAADLFVYDRARVLDGEIWRLVTGHAVHFSPSHAGWNIALFAVAGAWLERAHRARYLWLIGVTVLASSLWFLAAMPEMTRYGGLSGVVSAMVVFLSLSEMRRGGFARAIWVTILLLFAAKIGYEIVIGAALFAAPGATPFQVAPAAHIIGAAVAVVASSRHIAAGFSGRALKPVNLLKEWTRVQSLERIKPTKSGDQ